MRDLRGETNHKIMAQNILSQGDIIEMVIPTGGCTVGKGLLVGTVVGVALSTAVAAATASVAFSGVALVDKATGSAWTLGEKLYWDDTAKKFTDVSTSNTEAGFAVAAAASGDTTGYIKLVQ